MSMLSTLTGIDIKLSGWKIKVRALRSDVKVAIRTTVAEWINLKVPNIVVTLAPRGKIDDATAQTLGAMVADALIRELDRQLDKV